MSSIFFTITVDFGQPRHAPYIASHSFRLFLCSFLCSTPVIFFVMLDHHSYIYPIPHPTLPFPRPTPHSIVLVIFTDSPVRFVDTPCPCFESCQMHKSSLRVSIVRSYSAFALFFMMHTARYLGGLYHSPDQCF